jgi:hypothetical protein
MMDFIFSISAILCLQIFHAKVRIFQAKNRKLLLHISWLIYLVLLKLSQFDAALPEVDGICLVVRQFGRRNVLSPVEIFAGNIFILNVRHHTGLKALTVMFLPVSFFIRAAIS